MNGATLLLWALALGALALCARRGPQVAGRALRECGQAIVRVAPLILCTLPMAAFLAELVPEGWAVRWLGADSGFIGVVIGAAAGGFLPGGPFVAFPLVLGFLKAGAGAPQLVALITGWAIYGLHRTIAWELPILGARFVLLRMTASLALPILAGLLAELLLPAFPGATIR